MQWTPRITLALLVIGTLVSQAAAEWRGFVCLTSVALRLHHIGCGRMRTQLAVAFGKTSLAGNDAAALMKRLAFRDHRRAVRGHWPQIVIFIAQLSGARRREPHLTVK